MVLSVYYQNVRGLRSKIEDTKLNILCNNFDIICLTETNLQEHILSSEIFDSRYIVFRKDRNLSMIEASAGGGCLIAVKSEIFSNRMLHFETEFEDLWVEIKLKNLNLIICCIYIRPQSHYDIYEKVLNNISETFAKIKKCSKFIILGDFNLPHISWEYCFSLGHSTPLYSSNRCSTCLINNMSFCNFQQVNNILNFNNVMLDLVFTNLVCNNLSIKCSTSPISRIDIHHPPLDIVLSIEKQSLMSSICSLKHNFFRVDINKFSDYLNSIDFALFEFFRIKLCI